MVALGENGRAVYACALYGSRKILWIKLTADVWNERRRMVIEMYLALMRNEGVFGHGQYLVSRE